MLGAAFLALTAADPARALVIDAGYDSSITSSPDSADIEASITTALDDIERLYSNPGTVNILFNIASGSFLGESQSSLYGDSYGDYTSLLAADAAVNPANTVLSTAVANLSYGNDSDGSRPIFATSALFRVALGDSAATPCFDAGGTLQPSCGQLYDGVVTLSSNSQIMYTRPLPAYNSHTDNVAFDAVSIIEHEVDEVLGGGGSGSSLNAVAAFGLNSDSDPLTSYDGALDLYRYAAPYTPGFTTDPSATAYLSVDGGRTDIVGFNQYSQGDFGDFGPPTTCPSDPVYLGGPVGDVQDAFTCPNLVADETALSPEYKMLEAIGYDPAPEPGSLALLTVAIAGLLAVRRRGASVPGRYPASPAT